MYAATIDDQKLNFCVFGVWRKNMVMRDSQTSTIWQQATGEAIDGPLKGRKLKILFGWETAWGALQKSSRGASYALKPEKFTGLFPKRILERMLQITHHATLSGLSPNDQRLDSRHVVIGMVINGVAKVYPLDVLRSVGTIKDEVGGEVVHLLFDNLGDQVIATTPDGKALPYERLWWAGWSEFHPRSEIYNK